MNDARSISFVLALLTVLSVGAPHALAASAPATAPAPAKAQPTSLATLLADVRQSSPALLAAQRRYEAARARVGSEGLRPDPMLEAGVMSVTSLMGPQVSISQMLPLGGKLSRARELAEAEAAVAHLEYLSELNRVSAEVKEVYYELAFLEASEAIVVRSKQLLEQMIKVATARYGVGQGKQSDVVRANTQLAEMLHEALMVRQERETATATLMSLVRPGHAVGHDGDLRLPAMKAPTPVRMSLGAALAQADARNPELRRARAVVSAGESVVELARTTDAPDVTARLGVGQSYMGMGWETAVSGMVGTTLPFESRKREEALVAAAEADLAARKAALEEARRLVHVGLQQALTHVRHREEQLKLFELGVLPQARQTVQSELANYQVGRSDFDAVLTARMALYSYEREYHRALADYLKQVATLDTLTGKDVAAATEAP